MSLSIGKFFYNKLSESKHFKNSPYIHSSNYFTLQESYEIYKFIANKLTFRINSFYHREISIEFIKNDFDNITYRLDWASVCLNTDIITENDILENSFYPWSFIDLAKNKNFSLQFWKKIMKKFNLKDIFQYHHYASINDFDSINYDICLKLCFYSKSITIREFEKILNLFDHNMHGRLYKKYSNNFNLSFEYICKNVSKPWDWDLLSCNESICIYKILESRFEHFWNFDKLYFRSDFTIWLAKQYGLSTKKFLYSPFLTADDIISNGIVSLESLNSKYFLSFTNWTIYDVEKYHKLFIDEDIFDDAFYYNLLMNGKLNNLNNQGHHKFIRCKKLQVNKYYDELMAITWHPNRLYNWIWSENEKKEWDTFL